MNPARLRAYLMLLAVSAIWGVASPVIKFTLQAFDPDIFLTYRYFISTLLAIVIFIFAGLKLPRNLNTIIVLIVYAFLNSVVGLGLLFFGMDNTTVLDMTLITLLMPLIVSTAGVIFLNEKVTKREKIGIGIAIIGTLLTVVEPLFINNGASLKISGNLLILGYVASTTITAVLAKRLLRQNVEPITLVNSSFIIGFISFFAFIWYSKSLFGIWDQILTTAPIYHAGVWFMAVISGTLAFWLSNKAQKTIEIGEQSLFSYLYPIFSLPLAVLWLGETFTTIHIIGGVVIAIGVAIAEIKKKRYIN
ncbi:MAG: DMT family transporter [bacterium]|nr:MAG: DMT family transporter [bacterium]